MKSIFAALILLLSGCLLPEDEYGWTVMSWNVQNLFDGTDDGTEYPEFDPEKGDWNERLYQRRLDRTAEVILKTVPGGADLIVLQELENQRVLDNLVNGPLNGRGYNYSFAVPGFSIIRCGILSRYQISAVSAVDCGEWAGRPLRPALSFTVTVEGESIRVFALHWKSPRGNRAANEAARIREAGIVRDLLGERLKANQNARIIVLGDLNTPGDGMVEPAALAPYGDFSGDTVLWRTDTAEFPPFDPAQIVLFDPQPIGEPPGTYNYRGEWDRPDRALLTPGFTQGDGLRFESIQIGGSGIMLDSRGEPQIWRTDLEEGYSDHLPLILNFRLIASAEEE
ncbi:MAG: hypothetical protein B0D92_08600 [Spirochaeta sp. LUC14_002_19_P3]|nr:MAG: hypothetical protein B0D92_08600 [Spirochaeta sp. LUC14_002_19_P3]